MRDLDRELGTVSPGWEEAVVLKGKPGIFTVVATIMLCRREMMRGLARERESENYEPFGICTALEFCLPFELVSMSGYAVDYETRTG